MSITVIDAPKYMSGAIWNRGVIWATRESEKQGVAAVYDDDDDIEPVRIGAFNGYSGDGETKKYGIGQWLTLPDTVKLRDALTQVIDQINGVPDAGEVPQTPPEVQPPVVEIKILINAHGGVSNVLLEQ